MGMYDTVVVSDYKLPQPSKEIVKFLKEKNEKLPSDFQTKDLENALFTYYINSNGQLFEEKHVPTGKKVRRSFLWDSWKDNRTFLEKLYYKFLDRTYSSSELGKLRTLPEFKKVKKKSNITQTITIYTGKEIADRYVDIDYKIEIIKGRVKKITLSSCSIESEKDSKKRKESNRLFEEKMHATIEARRVFTSKWYYPILREFYNPIVFFGRKIIQYTCNRIVNWTIRWRTI